MNQLPARTSPNFGDKRLSKRYTKIIEATLKEPTQSFTSIFRNWHQLKAVYRFFDNPKITQENLIQHQYRQTISHIEHLDTKEDVLVLQDTTNLNYKGHKKKKDLLPTHPYVKKGLNLHPSIAFSSSRINLGLLHATIWTGKEKEAISDWKRKSRPIEEKESYKWLESIQITQKVAEKHQNRSFFNIADREGDIYDLFLKVSKDRVPNLYFIVRSSVNRKTITEERKLREAAKAGEEVGRITFDYKRGNEKRLVVQTIKIREIELDSPKRRPHLEKLNICVVQAEEINPPKGQTPINWTILTNYPVNSLEDAKKILHYYTLRWDIEIFFKILKSGCEVEKIRLETQERLNKCLTAYMAVACRIMFLLKVGKICPNLPCDMLFSSDEWQVVYMATNHKKPPSKPPLLQAIILGIAKLGGYLNRKSDPPPGPKAYCYP